MMRGNICGECLQLARGTLDGMTSVARWDKICKVCRKNIAAFYARTDEIDRAKNLTQN